ncbi:hypothetical protein FUAX_47350 (plasmid) [Fulvitalea axinellae]|uniref:Nitroreductase domain-containing protein n=1 Tax=Fulvitalea axinellae TaxID=1182444 RepID=A0AAU9CWD7_9BACT|nr:hypothetical protein FUAX_47350 [Fulvitalea axinellae]
MKKNIDNLFYEQNLSPSAIDFIESSKVKSYDLADFGRHIGTVMSSGYHMRQIIGTSVELGNTEKVALNTETKNEDRVKELRRIQNERKSTRAFGKGMDLDDLSALLLNSYFVIDGSKASDRAPARRSIASGGAVYSIDQYFINLNVVGLERGVYYYNLQQERLDKLPIYDGKESLFEKRFADAFYTNIRKDWDFDSAGGVLVSVATLSRASCKYKDRGVRFALMDAGSIMQNVHLAAAALDLAVCANGGYLDDQIGELLGLIEPDEIALNTMIVGRMKTE